MSFGGTATAIVAERHHWESEALSLDAWGGVFNVANPDSGQLTTGAPAGTQDQLLATMGPGAGNWTAAQVARVGVSIQALADNVANVRVACVAKNLVGGNLVLDFKSQEAGAPGLCRIRVDVPHSITQG